jgi:hypothetical protein
MSRTGRARFLRRLAPSGLAQMPSILTEPESDELRGATQDVTQQRMLQRDDASVGDAGAETLLVLTLEDLH